MSQLEAVQSAAAFAESIGAQRRDSALCCAPRLAGLVPSSYKNVERRPSTKVNQCKKV